MGHTFDGCIGDEISNEVELGSTRLAVVGGDSPDCAAVEVDSIVRIVQLFEVGQVPLVVEQICEKSDLFSDGFVLEGVFCFLDEATASSIEDSADQFGVFFFNVFEEFDREAAVGGDEQWFGEIGGVVSIGGPSGVSSVLSSFDETGRPECAEVLSDRARRDVKDGGEFVGRRFAASLQSDEDPALGC